MEIMLFFIVREKRFNQSERVLHYQSIRLLHLVKSSYELVKGFALEDVGQTKIWGLTSGIDDCACSGYNELSAKISKKLVSRAFLVFFKMAVAQRLYCL